MNKNNEFQICRLCGYIRSITKDGNVCPACGAPATAFVPYDQNVSPIRRKILELGIHPIIVHFTISYTVSTALLFVLSFITPVFFGIKIRDGGIFDFFVLLLPLFALAGGLTGLLSGKTRYRKLRTPFLKIKMILASSFFVVSIITLAAHLASEGGTKTNLMLLEFLLVISATILAALLGHFGSKLICPIVPKGTENR
ncbi:MAG: hypothetical protein ACFFCW_46290 [Candidatus Hodarchaeota archaeon]